MGSLTITIAAKTRRTPSGHSVRQSIRDNLLEGQKDDSVLDEADEVRFSAMVGERFWFYRHQWDREQHGILAKGVWERNSPVLIRTLTTKRGAHWWTLNKSTVPPEFMRDLDARIEAEQTRSVR